MRQKAGKVIFLEIMMLVLGTCSALKKKIPSETLSFKLSIPCTKITLFSIKAEI